MRTLIIEDEKPAAKRLSKLLSTHSPDCEILEMIDSVEAATKWLTHFPKPDLIFMDIQLADGLSFDIFSKVDISSPVIFTTAFDQYTLRAFKVNSVDYLLKPIDSDELKQALEKYRTYYHKKATYDSTGLEQMLRTVMAQQTFKERFLVKSGQHFSYISVADISYFFSEDGITFAQTRSGKKHIIESTLDQLSQQLNPKDFFRVNRQLCVHIHSVGKISTWFNSRLKLELEPKNDVNMVVSRERVSAFKDWLDG